MGYRTWCGRACPEPDKFDTKEDRTLKLLALDLGERRIGLAVSGPGNLVLPSGHLRRSKLSEDVRQVLRVAQDKSVDGFVIGIPYSLDEAEGVQAKRARGFVKTLEKQTDLPVFPMDERFTSVEAEGLLREAGHQPSREKSTVDEAAAVLILQRFLEQQRE